MRTLFSELRHRLRALLFPAAAERDLQDELQFHLEREAERHRAAGLAGDEAARRARREFGGLEPVKDACRDERGIGPLERTMQDLRYAVRTFRRTPLFSTAVVLTLALGVGATTTIFGVVDGVLLRPLPYADPDRIVQIGTVFGGGTVQVSAVSAPDARDLERRSRALTAVAGSRVRAVDLTGDGGAPERVSAAIVTASYFDVLGVPATLGRVLARDDQASGRDPVAVLSHGLWRRRFGGAGDVLGQRLVLNGVVHHVVGVMPRRFRAPDALGERDVEVWLPRPEAAAPVDGDRDAADWSTIARLTRAATVADVRRDLDAIGEAIARDTGGSDPRRFWIGTLLEQTVGDSGRQLWLLLGAVSVLLAIACANVAHLCLVRATERTREMAVRLAMGAGRGRIVRQLLTENLVLAVAGGGFGVLLAHAGLGAFRALGPADLPRLADVMVDVRVLGFSLAITAVAGLSFGLVPAFDAARAGLTSPLRATAAQVTGSRARLRARHALVVAQTALAVTLLVGAGLLANSLWRLGRIAPGFATDDVVWMDVRLPDRYADGPRRLGFYDDLLARTRALRGVAAAAGIAGRPLGGGNAVATMLPEGRRLGGEARAPRFPLHAVTPGYFATMGIPLVDGRDVVEGDRASSLPVAIVSRSMAAELWPGERAVGKRLWIGRIADDAPLVTVVGVVEDVRQYRVAEAAPPMAYRPFAQSPGRALAIVARHDGRSARQVLLQMRDATWAIDAGLPIGELGTMAEGRRQSIAEPRFRALALGTFSVVAAVLASIGLYATLAWMVRARRREVSIRIALGAAPSAIRARVLASGVGTATLGVALGLALALAASRVLDALVFGVTTRDPATFAAASGAMLAVAVLASWIPAQRAAQTDPAGVLRE